MTEPINCGYIKRGHTRLHLITDPDILRGGPSFETLTGENPHEEEGNYLTLVSERSEGLDCQNLKRPVVTWDETSENHVKSEYDDFTIFSSAFDLSRLGVFSGEWVCCLVLSCFATNRYHRSWLLRVLREDHVYFRYSCRQTGSKNTIFKRVRVWVFIRSKPQFIVNDSLLRNLLEPSDSETKNCTLQLQPSPKSIEPCIPTAKSVTLARVLSASSTNKLLQPVVLSSLMNHLSGCRRLLKEGDIFAVPVVCDSFRVLASPTKAGSPSPSRYDFEQ